MPKREDIKSILVIGSGPIVIGQACEFDYSGTQAVKALKEEGYRVILINSNPATIMTDQNFADKTYIEPITAEFVEKVIEKERPDVLLPTIGGQTALNVSIEVAENGVLEKYDVELIGAGIEAITKAEDRQSFKEVVTSLGLDSATSEVVYNLEEGKAAADKIGYPLIIRPSRTLGGSGGGVVEDASQLEEKLNWGFECSPIGELLLEESLVGWKEYELEIMRDKASNAVVVCSIENFDPMGLHTGDSVTVAPVQTLTDKEYQDLRDASISLMNEIGVDTGGSNVQFAVCPKTGRQVVIELNPRVSRSSALASKATGFPIARIAAKLAVGYTLDELPNDITLKTPASFEPSIDYVVVKIPRFTFEKFQGADSTLGTQMKSVGEAMAIGRTFPEALQKAYRSLEIDKTGLFDGEYDSLGSLDELLKEIKRLNPVRPLQITSALALGASIEKLYELTGFDPWFLSQVQKIVELEKELAALDFKDLNLDILKKAKRLGESDARISYLVSKNSKDDTTEDQIRDLRHKLELRPSFKRIDTCAAEFESATPYLYSTYEEASEAKRSTDKKIIILGGGPNRIGQGLEFDYCCVHAAFSLKDAGFETIMLNCNPETVSTDFDTSDRLYFEPLTLEDVSEIVEREKPDGVIVQYGGQTPLRLADKLKKLGVPIIGTSPESIDLTEDREQFRDLLNKLGLLQAESGVASNKEEAIAVSQKIGFPLMVRPSFVLGGRAMAVIHSQEELEKYIEESVSVSYERPVLLDRFLNDAIEVDVDAISDGKRVIVAGIAQHIERAGIHSGDSSFILPSANLSDKILKEIELSTKSLAKEISVLGLMNVQYAVVKEDTGEEKLYVIEVNPRASRSVPFVSKVTGVPWAKLGARVMAGESLESLDSLGDYGKFLKFENYFETVKTIPYYAIKESVFPFVKFRGVDAMLGPEMRSTGEVMGIDYSVVGGFNRAQIASGMKLPDSGKVFFSVKDSDKEEAKKIAEKLLELKFDLVATSGTAEYLESCGISTKTINKVREGSPHVIDALSEGDISMVINTPEGTGPLLDSASIRSTATTMNIPLFTTVAAAELGVSSIERNIAGDVYPVLSLQEYLEQLS